jgi:hypothetical protein
LGQRADGIVGNREKYLSKLAQGFLQLWQRTRLDVMRSYARLLHLSPCIMSSRRREMEKFQIVYHPALLGRKPTLRKDASKEEVPFRRTLLSARYIPNSPGKRGRKYDAPTSGNRPIPSSGIAKRVLQWWRRWVSPVKQPRRSQDMHV